MKSEMISRLGYLVVGVGVLLGVFSYIRYGALTIALGMAIFAFPFLKGNWQERRIEIIISAFIFVALITIAVVLPHSNV